MPKGYESPSAKSSSAGFECHLRRQKRPLATKVSRGLETFSQVPGPELDAPQSTFLQLFERAQSEPSRSSRSQKAPSQTSSPSPCSKPDVFCTSSGQQTNTRRSNFLTPGTRFGATSSMLFINSSSISSSSPAPTCTDPDSNRFLKLCQAAPRVSVTGRRHVDMENSGLSRCCNTNRISPYRSTLSMSHARAAVVTIGTAQTI